MTVPGNPSAFGFDFKVENYLRDRGSQPISRFDAKLVLYVTKTMDGFDLTASDQPRTPVPATFVSRKKPRFADRRRTMRPPN